MRFRFLVFSLALAAFAAAPSKAQPQLTGVNLAGADFGEGHLPGTYGQHYIYPTTAEVDHFVDLGMNVFRLPFRWERLQRDPYEAFNATELARMDAFVEYATAAGAHVVLDPHNYARYYGFLIGSEDVPFQMFADFWERLAGHYSDNDLVIFGLMNEPHSMPTEQWLEAANAAIAAIRETDAENLILVPGNAWTGAHSWLQNWYGTPNGTVMQGVEDPLDNYAFDLHQYLDEDYSGTSATCRSTTVGSEKLQSVTTWLRQHGERGFLGEFGVAANDTCLTALDDMLDYIDANADVWLGWTWWAAGPWWRDYMFSIEPDAQGNDAPQTEILAQHLAESTEAESETADRGVQMEVWPNPARDGVTVSLELSRSAEVSAGLFDLLGRQIWSSPVETGAAGRFELSLETSHLPPSIYILRLQAGSDVYSRAVTVIR